MSKPLRPPTSQEKAEGKDWEEVQLEFPEECQHGGDSTTCLPCNRKKDQAKKAWNVQHRNVQGFSAMYSGYCGGCNGRIEVGDVVQFQGDMIMHEECAGGLFRVQD